MAEIPYQGRTVRDNLVQATEMLMARADGANELIAPMHFPLGIGDLTKLAKFLFAVATTLGIPLHEFALFFERILAYLTACDERRLAEFESQSWWEFTDAKNRSKAFQKFLATGMTRTLVAARAEEMSARTGLRHPDPVASGHGRGQRAAGPRPERPDERRLARPVGRAPARQERRGAALWSPDRRNPLQRRVDHGCDGREQGRLEGDRSRLLRGSAAGRDAEPAHQRHPQGGPAARPHRPPDHAMDERGPVLPRRACETATRPCHLHRLAVGAHRACAAAVLAAETRGLWQWSVQGHCLGGCFGLGRTRADLQEGRQRVHGRRDLRRGVGADGRPLRPRGDQGGERRPPIPRSGHRVPEPVQE